MKRLEKFISIIYKIKGGYIDEGVAKSYRTALKARKESSFLYIYEIFPTVESDQFIMRISSKNFSDFESLNIIYIESNGLVFGFTQSVYEWAMSLLSSVDSYFIITSNVNGLLYLKEPK